MPVVIKLLTLCLEDTTFKFRDKFYRMTDGLAMGSPVSPIVANIFMGDLERNALITMKDRPRLWLRYVDDVLSIVKRNSLEGMLVHLNAQNDAITFTKEDENEGKLPFLDGEIARKHARPDPNGLLSFESNYEQRPVVRRFPPDFALALFAASHTEVACCNVMPRFLRPFATGAFCATRDLLLLYRFSN